MLAAQIFLGKNPHGLIKTPKFNLMAWKTSENQPVCRAHFSDNLNQSSPIEGNETAQWYSPEGLAHAILSLRFRTASFILLK